MAVTRGQVDTMGVPLLERELPLAELADYAHEARAGSGRLVLVGGEAGVGKSALLEQLEIELPDARFSWGACDGLFIPRPLGPLFDLAGQLGGELQDLCRADAPREELFTALLRRIHEPGSLHVVVVEDIHWADEATLDLLLFLGRRLRTASALLICTYRDDALPASDPLRRVLGELGGGRSIRRMALAPLSAAAVGVLTEDSGLEAAELHRITGGNPFYVTAVLEAGTTDIPPSARDAVLSRVARLGETAREVLDVAALIGTRIEVSMLASVTPCAPPVIDDLLASGLLVGEGNWIRFRHEIGRLAVEQSIAPHRGALVHSRILAALLAADCNDDARMSFHAEAAGAGPAVLRHATSAARRASELASHRESAAQYERALRFSSSAGSRTVAELYDGWARELSLIDRSEEAADALEHALRRWRANGDRLRQGDTMRRLSVEMDRLCRGAAALAAAESALSLLEPAGPTVELAWAQANLANRLLLIDQYDAAVELARRAQATAEPLGVAEVVSNALNTEACAAAMQGQEGAALLRRALEIAVSGRFEEQAGRAFANLYSIHCGHRQFAEAERYFLDGIDYCREHEVHTYATCLLGERANTLEKTGRWVEARTLLAEVLDRAGASPGNRLCPLTRLGTIKARTGEPGVWECLDEAMRHADGSAEPQMIVPVRRARGPRPTGSREMSRPREARSNWRRRFPRPAMSGSAGPWPSGCAGFCRPASRYSMSRTRTGVRWKATRRRPRISGPNWAVRTMRLLPCWVRRRRLSCARPWPFSRTWARLRPRGSPGSGCASWVCGRSPLVPEPRPARIHSVSPAASGKCSI